MERAEDETDIAAPPESARKENLSLYLRFCRAILKQRLLWLLFCGVLLWFLVKNLSDHRLNFIQWDLLALSGFTFLVVGLHLAGTIPARMKVALTRLQVREILDIGDRNLDQLIRELEDRSLRWAAVAGPVLALIVTAAFVFAVGDTSSIRRDIVFILIRGAAAFVTGLHFGRMASYGALGHFLKRRTCHINVWPGHVDGAAGLKPIGDFYFYQAMVAAMPAMFLAAWVVLIPLIGRYEHWRDPYLGELVVAIVMEILAFVVPLVWFHGEMLESKMNLLVEADRLSTEYLVAPRKARDQQEDSGKDQAVAEWAKQRYDSIEALPTWPVDVKTRRKFSVNNLLLLLPLVGQTELAARISGVLGVFG